MNKKTKVLAVVPGLFPSTIIGIVKPLLRLDRKKQISFKVELTRTCTKSDILSADCIVFCRNCESEDLNFLYWAKEAQKKIIYEIDDNFFEMDTSLEIGKYHRHPARLFAIKEFYSYADIIHVYSNPLFENASKFNNSVKKINSYFDFDLIETVNKKSKGDKISIVYATSRGENDELSEMFENAILRIISKYKNSVEFFVWGHIPNKLKGYQEIKKLPYIRDYNKYVKYFYENNFDIGLAPLKNDVFHRSKTNNKFREYGACGVAGIYSNVDVYSDCVSHNETGLLVNNNEEEWYNALEKLIINPELRTMIQNNARIYVRNNYSVENSEGNWIESINCTDKNDSIRINKGYIGVLKIIVIIDKINEVYIKNRINAFTDACIFLKAHVDFVYNDNVDIKFNNYDLILYFVKDYKVFINTSYLIINIEKPIIVDFTETPTENEINSVSNLLKKIMHKVVIPEDVKYAKPTSFIKTQSIIEEPVGYYQLEEIFYKVAGVPLSHLFLYEDNQSFDSLILKIKSIPSEIKLNKYAFYQLGAPISLWIDILLQYEGSRRQQSKLKLYLNMKLQILRKKLSFPKVRKLYNFSKKAASTGIILVKINLFKKYK